MAVSCLIACEKEGWIESNIEKTDVVTFYNLTDGDSLDIFCEKGYAVEYKNKGVVLKKHDLLNYVDSVAADSSLVYFELSYQLPDIKENKYEYITENNDTFKLDQIIQYKINGQYFDSIPDGSFDYGDKITDANTILDITYYVKNPIADTLEVVNYDYRVGVSVKKQMKFD